MWGVTIMGLTRIVESHNYLNGVKFSVIEFALISLVLSPFAVYYLWHGQFVYGSIATGIAVNCLTVVVLGARAWRAGQMGLALGSWTDPKIAARAKQEHPIMLRQTLLLTASCLVPFAAFGVVLYERRSQPPAP